MNILVTDTLLSSAKACRISRSIWLEPFSQECFLSSRVASDILAQQIIKLNIHSAYTRSAKIHSIVKILVICPLCYTLPLILCLATRSSSQEMYYPIGRPLLHVYVGKALRVSDYCQIRNSMMGTFSVSSTILTDHYAQHKVPKKGPPPPRFVYKATNRYISR